MIHYRRNPEGDFTILIAGQAVCCVADEQHAKLLTGQANLNVEAVARRIANLEKGLSTLRSELDMLACDLVAVW